MGHWCDVCLSKGWDTFLDEETMKLRTQRFLWYFAYERSEHKLKARSICNDRAAVCWMHLWEQRGNPFAGLEAVDNFLTDMEKIDGPTEPKLPVPLTLLQSMFALLKTDPKYASGPLHYRHSCIKGALLTGFWFLLRSAEYLAEDEGHFNPTRSLNWANVTPWLNGKRLPLHRIADADEISLVIYSGKNNLETHTRSLPRVAGSDVCVVAALAGVYAAYHKKIGTAPLRVKGFSRRTLCSISPGLRFQITSKLAADVAGIPMGRVASHSLRRGGATQYVASGLSDQHVARFGR